ncbi:hypothetical protein L227DRAFT_387395 [Lentinus tigrinus ALCF2SS1-6]|uniref:Uncharacterized protein n=1 Tax=Lentinus tigrinus ALCF2SS1-6 TaxID=1328759 RepID=A0A5C2SHQ3_9APHY|nr:hypothetical protein L227DRAFT_387395 [Lentinus tigrinus ALCF2SS1-6]
MKRGLCEYYRSSEYPRCANVCINISIRRVDSLTAFGPPSTHAFTRRVNEKYHDVTPMAEPIEMNTAETQTAYTPCSATPSHLAPMSSYSSPHACRLRHHETRQYSSAENLRVKCGHMHAHWELSSCIHAHHGQTVEEGM